MEDSIYTDLRTGDGGLDQIEQDAEQKLASFPALSRDVFQSFYSLLPRRYGEEALSVAARKFNVPILDHITQSEDFPTLKAICEGRELPAYEAAAEFTARTADELDSLLSDLGGDKNALNTLEKLENAEEQAQKDLVFVLLPVCTGPGEPAQSVTEGQKAVVLVRQDDSVAGVGVVGGLPG